MSQLWVAFYLGDNISSLLVNKLWIEKKQKKRHIYQWLFQVSLDLCSPTKSQQNVFFMILL